MKTTPCNFILNTVFFERKQLLLFIINKTKGLNIILLNIILIILLFVNK
jgi:hypothetical protein